MAEHLRSYECRVPRGDWSPVSALTRSKARAEYWRQVRDCCPDLKIHQVEVRGCSAPIRTDRFARVAAYRGVPLAQPGMTAYVEDRKGLLVDGNNASNFDVLFLDGPHAGQTLNCHPNWEMRYIGADGVVIYDFRKGVLVA